jgi:peptidoglycan/LPS O-acetylase OafA/YrhL
MKRLPGLDGLRAISIALVVASHVGHERGIFVYGSFGVQIFFVLSGFLITRLLCIEEERYGQISLPAFYRRRALRILPAAFTYLAAIAVFTSPKDLLYCVIFVRNLVAGKPVTGHFWSLSIEEQFYLLWPVTFLLLRTNRRRLKVAIVMCAVAPVWRAIAAHLAGGPQFIGNFRTDLTYDALLGGCSLALLYTQGLLRSGVMRSPITPVLAALSLVLMLRPEAPSLIAPTCRIMAVAIIINYAVQRPGGWLNWAPLVWLGQLSYSLYLWQQPFCWYSRIPVFTRFPLNVAASITMAALSFYFVEKPFLRLRDRTARPRNDSRSAPEGVLGPITVAASTPNLRVDRLGTARKFWG